MAKSYGEGFQQPLDYETGNPIPGSPQIGAPSTNRPWPSGNGFVVITNMDALESNEPRDPSPIIPTPSRYTR